MTAKCHKAQWSVSGHDVMKTPGAVPCSTSAYTVRQVAAIIIVYQLRFHEYIGNSIPGEHRLIIEWTVTASSAQAACAREARR